MSPSRNPTSRRRRRSESPNNKSAKKRLVTRQAQVDSGSDSDVIILDSDEDETQSRRVSKPADLEERKNTPKGKRTIWSSTSEGEGADQVVDLPSKKARLSTEQRTESEVSKNILPAIKLPPFLPTENIHKNWVFWRLYSEEIYSTYDKHLVKFDGEYLSRYLLGEIFHEKINDEDADFDPSIFFQAVQINHIHHPFSVGKGRKRLLVDCEEITTSTNAHMQTSKKKRELIAEESLVDLLSSTLKKGDLLIVFGDIQIEESQFINLNSRYQHPILMAHYRHDGNFGPVSPASKDFQDVMQPCLNSLFSHTVHEFDDHEYAIKISPCPSAVKDDEETLIPTPRGTSNLLSPRRHNSKKGVSQVVPQEAPQIINPTVPEVTHEQNRADVQRTAVSKRQSTRDSESDESSNLCIDIVKEIEEHGILDSSTRIKGAPDVPEVTVKSRSSRIQQAELEQKQFSRLSLAYGLKECSIRLEKLKTVS